MIDLSPDVQLIFLPAGLDSAKAPSVHLQFQGRKESAELTTEVVLEIELYLRRLYPLRRVLTPRLSYEFFIVRQIYQKGRP